MNPEDPAFLDWLGVDQVSGGQASFDPLAGNEYAANQALDNAQAFQPNASPVPDELLDVVSPPPIPQAEQFQGQPAQQQFPPPDFSGVSVSQTRQERPSADLQPAFNSKFGFQAPPSVEEAAANVASGYATREAGLGAEVDATTELNDVLAQGDLNQQSIVNESIARRNQLEKQHAEAGTKAQAHTAELTAAIEQTNPARLWHDANTAQKAAGLASAFIGGFLAPYNGGRNVPLETMMQMIDQDIKAQQMDQENQRFKVGQSERASDKLLDTQQRALQSYDLEVGKRLTAAAKGVEAESRKYASKFTQAKMQQLAGEWRVEAGKYFNEYTLKTADMLQSQLQSEEQLRQGRAHIAISNRAQQMQKDEINYKRAQDAAAAQAAPQYAVHISPVSGEKYAIDPQRYGDPKHPQITNEKRSELDANWQLNADLADVARELATSDTYAGLINGSSKLTSSQREQAVKGLYGELKLKVGKQISGASVSPQQEKFINDLVGSMETSTSVSPKAQLRQFVKGLAKDQTRVGKSLGFKKVNPDGSLGDDYSGDSEMFVPELEDLKAPTAGGAVKTIKNFNPAVGGADTVRGVVDQARWVHDNLDKLTPSQVQKVYGDLRIKAADSQDPATRRALEQAAYNIEARLRAVDALQQSTGGRGVQTLTVHDDFDNYLEPQYLKSTLGGLKKAK